MNKRQKKKRALQSQVNFLIAENALLIEAQKNGVRERRVLEKRLTELEKIVSDNALASNERFDQVEVEVVKIGEECGSIQKLRKIVDFFKMK